MFFKGSRLDCPVPSSFWAALSPILSRLHSETPFFVKPFLISLPGKNLTVCLVFRGPLFPYMSFSQSRGLFSAVTYFPTCPLLLNCEFFEKGVVSWVLFPELARNRSLWNALWMNIKPSMRREHCGEKNGKKQRMYLNCGPKCQCFLTSVAISHM